MNFTIPKDGIPVEWFDGKPEEQAAWQGAKDKRKDRLCDSSLWRNMGKNKKEGDLLESAYLAGWYFQNSK